MKYVLMFLTGSFDELTSFSYKINANKIVQHVVYSRPIYTILSCNLYCIILQLILYYLVT